MTRSAPLDTMTARLDLLKRLDNHVLTKAPTSSSGPVSLTFHIARTSESSRQQKSQLGKRAVGKSGDAPKPTGFNLAANRTLQAGEVELYKGRKLSRLNRALKKEKDDEGLQNLLSSPPNFSVFGDTISFTKQRELGINSPPMLYKGISLMLPEFW